MIVRFYDGTEINAIVVNGQTRFFQNAQRDSLEFVFKKDEYPFDTLDGYFADRDKTRKITIIEPDTGAEYIYEDYVLRVSMVMSPVVIKPATSKTPEVTEERISVTMAQQTYLEKLVEQLLGE